MNPERHVLVQRLKDSIDALAYPYRHTEVVNTTHNGKPHRYRHVTRHAPLIQQLQMHVKDDEGTSARGRPSYESGPPLHLHAIDRHQAIESECLAWLIRMGVRPRRTLVECLRSLVGGAQRLDDEELADLAAAARSWWCWARTVSGWDTPPWKPWGPCPVCKAIGCLRVREEARTAVCVNCWAHWDSSGIEALGAYIRLWVESQGMKASAA